MNTAQPAGAEPTHDYFCSDIPTSRLKPCHFDPALSDGNIKQVYGKLHPRAVHHTGVMAPAFELGVWAPAAAVSRRKLEEIFLLGKKKWRAMVSKLGCFFGP